MHPSVRSMQVLNISWCWKITDEGLADIATLVGLEALALEGCWQVGSLLLFVSLHLMDTRYSRMRDDISMSNAIQATYSLLHFFESGILTIDLPCSKQITDEGLECLTALKGLQSLNAAWYEYTP